jgi:hypothetical protein
VLGGFAAVTALSIAVAFPVAAAVRALPEVDEDRGPSRA